MESWVYKESALMGGESGRESGRESALMGGESGEVEDSPNF